MYDIIIIGAGCSGLTASIYAARSGKSVLVLEAETIGGQISFAPKVENYPGIRQISGMELSDNLYEQAISLGVIIELETVMRIEVSGKRKIVITESGKYEGNSIIIASGAKHRKLGVEREEAFGGRGISYCAICDGAFYKGQVVAIVGGGSAALQSAEYLSGLCKTVLLIHRRDSFKGEQKLAQRLKAKPNVILLMNSVIQKLIGDDTLESIIVRNLTNGQDTKLMVKGLFVSVGQSPDNKQFENLVSLDDKGYILAGEDCITSADGIFAAGDCRTKSVRQLVTAAADGAVSALSACVYSDFNN